VEAEVALRTGGLEGGGGLYRGIEAGGNDWMELACEVAREAVARGGGPFGAVVLQIDDATSEVIRYWTHHNHVVAATDPTAHAEVLALRSACASLGVVHLDSISREDSLLPQPGATSHAVVYSSAEPCPMCYAAIRWAHVRALYFAATRFDASAPGVEFSDEAIYDDLATPYAERSLVVRQCATANALDAFRLWKRVPHARY
jgi:tRNA(Arg) A34 adenosine deaminase TadA